MASLRRSKNSASIDRDEKEQFLSLTWFESLLYKPYTYTEKVNNSGVTFIYIQQLYT